MIGELAVKFLAGFCRKCLSLRKGLEAAAFSYPTEMKMEPRKTPF